MNCIVTSLAICFIAFHLALIPEHFWSHVLLGVNWFSDVSPQLDWEPPEDWSEWQPSLHEQPVEEVAPTRKKSEGFSDVLSEDRKHGNIRLESCSGKAEPLSPENVVVVVTKLGLVHPAGSQTLTSCMNTFQGVSELNFSPEFCPPPAPLQCCPQCRGCRRKPPEEA